MIVQIQKLNPNAKAPEYAHPGDAGMDLFTNQAERLQPGQRITLTTGIALAIPEGYVGLIWEKSGRASREGLGVMAGVIDAGYRGEIQVVVINHGSEPITITHHQKIAQLLIQPVVSATLEAVESFTKTVRGQAGFGSTGL